ncbi:2-dehydropantoate 2-reductase [Paenibacillus sp. LHD-38]|uniref:ketopantoate reductase family protein n=1 Tax=Paenibacillus sp. LHD-38 TaxID=3072143 RepID=UPI00280D073E|nr:2-dehydropantoate 2-reductase [Paenibacillus sp. LHD-38]MDQ8736844.1 2-dehydropantoate 2-reductase [Paenibacillus sp. LHD-38]
MQIDVVGGGSLGLLYGAKLAEAGADVTIWTRSKEQAALLTDQGTMVRELGGTREHVVRIKGVWGGHADRAGMRTENNGTGLRWLVLAVKQTDVDELLLELLDQLAACSNDEHTPIICLQNGIGHLDRIKSKLPNNPLFAAVTTEGAKRLDARSVEHTGRGELWLGEWAGNERNPDNTQDISLKMLVSTLQSAGFATFLSNDMENRIYYKLLINAIINPLTALFDVENGELPLHPSRKKLMRALYAESEFILERAGMALQQDGWQLVLDVCRNTSRNISSMLSDIRAGRATEIDAINGGVVMLAEKFGLQAPLNQAVIEFVKALHPMPSMGE